MVSKSTLRSFKNYYKQGDIFSRVDLMRSSLMLSAPTAQALIEELLQFKLIDRIKVDNRHSLEKVYMVC